MDFEKRGEKKNDCLYTISGNVHQVSIIIKRPMISRVHAMVNSVYLVFPLEMVCDRCTVGQ